MKKLLILMTSLSVVGGTAPLVIACNNKQTTNSPYKEALKKLIDEAEKVVASASENSVEVQQLKSRLEWSKKDHWRPDARDCDYIESANKLDEAIKEYQNPGYKEAKEKLIHTIKDANRTIEGSTKTRSQEIIDNLEKALIKAKIVLKEEGDPSIIKLAADRVEYWRHMYLWGKDISNDNIKLS